MAGSGTGPGGLVRALARAPRPVGLRRARLVEQLAGPAAPRLALVVAPAGCGKTTLLSHLAEAAAPSVAWLTLERDLASTPTFLAHLQVSCGAAAAGQPPWSSATDALEHLDRLAVRTVLVLDELHTIARGPALEVVRLILRHQPDLLRVAVGARQLPELEVARLRLTGGVRDVGADDLRFRTWEVEELFRTCHDVRLAAGEVSLLAQRTAGWAAGLQLFHLATGGRPQSARAGLLASGLGGGRLATPYLAEQVLEQVPAVLRDFVLRTSVLARLSPSRCDELLGAQDSAGPLEQLERAGLLVGPGTGLERAGGSAEYRYHDVLQTHLLEQLEVRFGAATARELHRRAGVLWRDELAHADAVRSFCRAQDWDAVREVIEAGGEDLAGDRGSWLDLLPAAIHESDPWVSLALARRLLADGSVDAALASYDRAVASFAGLSGTEMAVREQRALRAWVDPPLGTVDDALHQVRLALVDPARVQAASSGSSATRWCAHGLALFVAGRWPEALAAFDRATQQPDGPAVVEALAALGRAAALTATGRPGAAEARRRAAAAAASVQAPVLERLADGLVRVVAGEAGHDDAVADLVARCRVAGDPWGEAVLRVLDVVHGLARGTTTPAAAGEAADLLDALPAPAAAVWARVAGALAAAREGQPWPRAELGRLERAASALGPLPHALVLVALADTALAQVVPDPRAADRALQGARALAARTAAAPWLEQIVLATGPAATPRTARPPSAGEPPADAGPPPRLQVEVLGRFTLTRDGEPVVLDGLRPLHRELLRLFCAHGDRALRRDLLVEWFWPGTDPRRAQHSLQVAVSELRRLLHPDAARGAPSCLQRDGAGYRLLVRPEDCDARRLEQEVDAGRVALRRGDHDAAVAHLEAAVTAYRGELLPEDGSAEWVLPERDRLREVAVAAHEQLAALRARAGDHLAAVAAARAGLGQDRHRDGLWRLLVASLVSLGEPVAAAAAQRDYDALLTELGIAVPRQVPSPGAGERSPDREADPGRDVGGLEVLDDDEHERADGVVGLDQHHVDLEQRSGLPG